MRSLQTSLSARLLADGLVGGQVIPLPGERLPFAATGTSVRKRAPYGYALSTTNHIKPKLRHHSPPRKPVGSSSLHVTDNAIALTSTRRMHYHGRIRHLA